MSDGGFGHEARWHAAVLAGDDAAWRSAYDAVYDSVRGYVQWRAAGWKDLADDALQETWLTAVRRIGDFDPNRGSFQAWMVGIAANVVRGALRTRKRRSARVEALVGDHAGAGDAGDDDRAERTARALDMLPEHYERVLRDKYLSGSSVAEMAEARGESCKAVESLLTRARAAFRELYQQENTADG